MNIKQILNEEFLDFTKFNNIPFGIYINPNGNDCKALIQEAKENEISTMFRTIVDINTDKVYISNMKILHYQIIKTVPELNQNNMKDDSKILHGYAYYIKEKGNKVFYTIEKEHLLSLGKYVKKYKELMDKYFTYGKH